MANVRSREEIEKEIKFCSRKLEKAIDNREWYEAMLNQMAINIFLWVLNDSDRKIKFKEETIEVKEKKPNIIKRIFTKEDKEEVEPEARF